MSKKKKSAVKVTEHDQRLIDEAKSSIKLLSWMNGLSDQDRRNFLAMTHLSDATLTATLKVAPDEDKRQFVRNAIKLKDYLARNVL